MGLEQSVQIGLYGTEVLPAANECARTDEEGERGGEGVVGGALVRSQQEIKGTRI